MRVELLTSQGGANKAPPCLPLRLCAFAPKLLVAVCCLMLVFAALPVAAQESPASSLQACTAVDEAALLDELNTLTQGVFASAIAEIDLQAIVEDQWAEQGLDSVVAAEVDRAVDRVSERTDWWNSFLSGWSADKARELTEAIAGETFASEGFRQAMDNLSTAVADDVSTRIGALSAEGVSAALYCLQTFIRGNYSGALLAAFEDEVRVAAANADIEPGGLGSSLLAVIDNHKLALGGIGVIIATQITKRLAASLAKRLSTRIAGRITARVLGRVGTQIIPIAGWIVGLGLFAWDIYDSRDGAIPEIQETLRSDEVMAGIRAEIVDAIQPELELELPQVAREIANDLHSQWLEVKRDIRVILDLAAKDPTFGALLDAMQTPDELARLVALTGSLIGAADVEAVSAAAANGTLQRAIELRADVTPIVESTGNLDVALAWSASAGQMLDEVVRLEIYKGKLPGDLDRATLQRLIDVEEPAAVAELALLPADALKTLLGVSSQSLVELSHSFDGPQLQWLAKTLDGFPLEARGPLVSRLLGDPSVLQTLQTTDLLEIVPPGGDLDAAIGFMSGGGDSLAVATDMLAVATGAPTFTMYQRKHGWPTTLLMAAIVALAALIVVRLVWGLGQWVLEPVVAIGSLGRRRTRKDAAHDVSGMQQTLDDTRREVDRLRRENEDLRTSSGGATYSSGKPPGYRTGAPGDPATPSSHTPDPSGQPSSPAGPSGPPPAHPH